MIPFFAADADRLIREDIPYFDLTSLVTEVQNQQGTMTYYTREDAILSGSEIASAIMKELGLEIVQTTPDGTAIEAGQDFFAVKGQAKSLFQAWKICLNAFDHMSGIATKTRKMVDAVQAINPHCQILTTRKSMPGAKDLATRAILAGGAYPHRLGLSETVLIFDHHIMFMGGFEAFVEKIPEIRARCIEKKLYVEAGADQALELAKAGVDGIQLDKVAPEILTELVPKLRAAQPNITLIATGGIRPDNAAIYAQTGVDGLATTSCYHAAPIDMSVRMAAL